MRLHSSDPTSSWHSGPTLSSSVFSLRWLDVPRGWACALGGALVLIGCGGTDHYAPAPTVEAGAASPRSGSTADSASTTDETSPSGTVSITESASGNERGLLDVMAIGAMKQSLGSLEFTVRSRLGAVLSRGVSDVRGADTDRRLLLDLPAGEDYELSLESTGSGESPSACHAKVGPFSVEANAAASYQAFLWQCDDAATPAPADECYWLADWVGASRTRAAVGETIELSVAGEDASGTSAHVNWVEQAPQFGSVSEKHTASTTFTCQAASDSIPIDVVVTGDGCSRRLTLSVACY